MVGDSNDRRSVGRIPIELRVEYRRMNAFFSDYTRNISKGGTFVKTGKPLPIGTHFRFQLAVPDREQPFQLEGEVVWQQNGGVEAGMGIRFVWADDAQRLSFEAAVEEMMDARLGGPITDQLLGRSGR